jgi:hypothetical protein
MQYDKKVSKEEFQVWKLAVSDSKGIATCEDGDGKVVYTQKTGFTDYPFPELELWYTGGVILLKSEY